MRQKLLFTAFFLSAGIIVFSQPSQEMLDKMSERIMQARISFIDNSLQLSDAQAKEFWPVFEAYALELEELKKREFISHKKRGQDGELDADEALKKIEEHFEIEQSKLNIRKSYHHKFLEILSPKELIKLHHTEREFRREVLERYKRKGPNRGN